MLKVSKREKMILGSAAAAVIWGVCALIPSPAKGSQQPAANAGMTVVKEFIAGLDALIKENSPPDKIEYAIRAAESEWGGDPFSKTDGEAAAALPGAKPAGGFDYSGYLEMNNRRLAVIDGVEYEAGELLEGDGYKVKDIFPYMVVVESIAEGKEIKINLHGIRDNRDGEDDATVQILPVQSAPAKSFQLGAQQRGNRSHEAGPSPKRQTLNVYGDAGHPVANSGGCSDEGTVCFVAGTD